MIRQKAPPAYAEFGIAFGGSYALDELDTGPYASGILPSAAGAAQPLSQDGARRDQPAFRFGQLAGQRRSLAGCAHANGDETSQQVGRHGESRTLRNVIHMGDDLNPQPGLAYQLVQYVGERLAGTLEA